MAKKPHIQGGFVILARAIQNSSLMKMKGNDVKFAMYLLADANWQDVKWYDEHQRKEIIVKRGEMVGTLRSWAGGASMSLQSVRSALKRLLWHGFIQDITPTPVKRAHGYTHLRIRKYETYQDVTNYVVAETTQGQHRTNTGLTQDQHTSLNKDKNLKHLKQKEVLEIFNYYLSKKLKALRRFDVWERKIRARLKKYSVEDLKVCIDNLANSTWHRENGYDGLDQIVNSDDRIEKWLVWRPKKGSIHRGEPGTYAGRKPDATQE